MNRMRGWAAAAACAALASMAAPAAGQDPFVPDRAEHYAEVTDWPDFTGVWNPDWSILFGRDGRRPVEPKLTPTARAAFDAFAARQEAEGVDQEAQVLCRPPGIDRKSTRLNSSHNA